MNENKYKNIYRMFAVYYILDKRFSKMLSFYFIKKKFYFFMMKII